MKSQLEQLFDKYPNLDFDNGNLYKSPKHTVPLYEDDKANDVVASFFDGREITIPHSSGNPELDEFRSVNGHVFIELNYAGDYKAAFKSIKDGI